MKSIWFALFKKYCCSSLICLHNLKGYTLSLHWRMTRSFKGTFMFTTQWKEGLKLFLFFSNISLENEIWFLKLWSNELNFLIYLYELLLSQWKNLFSLEINRISLFTASIQKLIFILNSSNLYQLIFNLNYVIKVIIINNTRISTFQLQSPLK